MPLISVVIPVYNVAAWLPTCIESLLKQNFSDYEIILVDDGSTDGESSAICDLYTEQYPQLISTIHQPNGGLGAARNTGLKHAHGEYLFFLDSDDYIAAETLAELAQQIEKHHSDIYLFGMIIERNGVIGETLIDALPYDKVFTMAEQPDLLLVAPTACCRIWKRELFINSGIRFPGRVWYEDIRTTLKLYALAQSVVCLNKAYYYYQIRDNSIMQSKNIDRNSEIMDALDDVLNYFERNSLSEQYHDELCYLTLDHVLAVASVRVLRQDSKHPLLEQFYNYTIKHFPDFLNNPYLQRMSLRKRLVFKLICHKHYALAAALFKVKEKLQSITKR